MLRTWSHAQGSRTDPPLPRPVLGSTGRRKDMVINLECHVYPGLRCPRVQLMEKSDVVLRRGIGLLFTGWRPGWTCPPGDLVRRRESQALPS